MRIAPALATWAAVSVLTAPSARAADRVIGPVARGTTMLSIVRPLCPAHDATCQHRAADAIFKANPNAFAGNAHALKAGAVLHIPEALMRVAMENAAPALAAKEVKSTATEAAPPAPTPAQSPTRKAEPAPPAPLHEAVVMPPPDLRRRAGEPVEPERSQPGPLPDPNAMSRLAPVAAPQDLWKEYDKAPIPDRWRLLDSLGVIHERWYDPYNQNTLKGDKPIRNGDEFIDLSAITDLIYEYRRLPTPVGLQGTTNPDSLGVFGSSGQGAWIGNLILSAVYYKGDTTFKPPDFELHFTPVLNLNYTRTEEAGAVNVNPGKGRYREDQWIGVQELFGDFHLRNVSDRYDFDSIRVGIQPFTSDFRGFLFQDLEPAVRLFGNRDDNLIQYNLIWIRRLEKNTNSGLNDVTRLPRNDDVYLFNLYRQDWPVLGFTSQAVVAHNRNREDGTPFYDDNGFLVRPAAIGTENPRRYHVTYYGYNGDGHFDRLNLTVSAYLAEGRQSNGVFADGARRIQSAFGAWEASVDFDWLRIRQSGVYASGDHNPYNGTATGFDAIYENPLIAGSDTSFWIRQAVPLIGGGGVALSARNGVLDSLRSSKDLGQSNFENPGLWLLGIGADADLLPELRLSGNVNHLWFDDPATLEVARNQGGINRSIGWDLSTALIWRPRFSQNIVARLSGAVLLPGEGYRDLYPDKSAYSVLADVIFAY
jgi:hypothetical protein